MLTVEFDEVKAFLPLSREEIDAVFNFINTDFSDCPKMTEEELNQFKPWSEIHLEWRTKYN